MACVPCPWDRAGPGAVSVPADAAVRACGQGATSLSDRPREGRNLGFYVKFLDVKTLAVTSGLVEPRGRYTNLCIGHTRREATCRPPWASLSGLSPGPGFQLSATISPALPGDSLSPSHRRPCPGPDTLAHPGTPPSFQPNVTPSAAGEATGLPRPWCEPLAQVSEQLWGVSSRLSPTLHMGTLRLRDKPPAQRRTAAMWGGRDLNPGLSGCKAQVFCRAPRALTHRGVAS